MSSNYNPFETFRRPLLVAASDVFLAKLAGEPLEEVSVLAAHIGDGGSESIQASAREQGELNVAARALGNLAFLQTKVNESGVLGRTVARLEIRLSKTLDSAYLDEETVFGEKGLLPMVMKARPLVD